MRRLARLAATAAMAAATATGCLQTEQRRYERALREAPPPARHAVQSERLRQVMANLERLAVDRLPQELDPERDRARSAAAVGEIAAALAASAGRIPDVLSEVELQDARREEFRALAEALERRSIALSRQAPDLGLAALRSEIAGIDATCEACHRRFRVLPAVDPLVLRESGGEARRPAASRSAPAEGVAGAKRAPGVARAGTPLARWTREARAGHTDGEGD